MRKISFAIIIFCIFFLVSPSKNISASSNSQSQQIVNYSDFQSLKDEVVKLRDENYQRAVQSAQDAGTKADKILNYLVGIATIYGIGLAIFTLFVGGNLWNMKRMQKQSLDSTRDTLNKMINEATIKLSKFEKKIAKLNSKEESKKDEFKNIVNEGKSLINDLRTMKNSATYISNATTSPSASISGTISAFQDYIKSVNITPPAYAGLKMCPSCGQWKTLAEFPSQTLSEYNFDQKCTLCVGKEA